MWIKGMLVAVMALSLVAGCDGGRDKFFYDDDLRGSSVEGDRDDFDSGTDSSMDKDTGASPGRTSTEKCGCPKQKNGGREAFKDGGHTHGK